MGKIAERKGSRLMRKVSLVLVGALIGAGAATVTTQTRLFSSTSAIAASAETYRQLSLFGDVFEKVRTTTSGRPGATSATAERGANWP